MSKDTEQIRQLENTVKINGTLAELEVREGIDKNKNDYISLNGKIQYGETGVEVAEFRAYFSSKTSKNEDSKAYKKCVEWVEKAIPMTKDKDKATKASITGEMQMNYYVDKAGEDKDFPQIVAKLFGDYKPEMEESASNATINFEGRIQSVVDETNNDEPTGRKRMTIIGCDFFKNPVIIKNIVIGADIVDDFEDNYNVGDTALFFLGYYIHKGEQKVQKSAGIGKQRVTQGNDYMELVLEGGNLPYEDEKDQISNQVIKIWNGMREERQNEARERFEKGGNTNTSARKGIGKTNTKKVVDSPVADDDEIPF